MDIHILDKESLMVMITPKSPFSGEKINELRRDVRVLKEKGAMGFIFDLSAAPFVGTGALTYLSVLGGEAVMGNDQLRLICPNRKVRLSCELMGLLKVCKFCENPEEAINDLKNVLFIEGDLAAPVIYKKAKPFVPPTTPGSTAKAPPPDEVVVIPTIPSTAEPGETLANVFQIQDVPPSQVSHAYMLPPGREDESLIQAELKHLSFKLKGQYDVFQKKALELLQASPEETLSKRSYPTREHARTFAIVQGTAPKVRHLLVSVGAYLTKKAKTLSYSGRALDEYNYDCYSVISILEPCELYGPPLITRKGLNIAYAQYSGREAKLQDLMMQLIDPLLVYVRGTEAASEDPKPE